MGEDLINQQILERLQQSLASSDPVVLATVIDSSRSVPRHAGSKMIIYQDGSTFGSIGGGEMEARVLKEAAEALVNGRPRLVSYELVDHGLGDPGICGGEVTLYLEAYMPTSTLLVVGCGHIGAAVIELGHWMGFRVVAYDDRTELATAKKLPEADFVASGDFEDLLKSSPITDQTHVVVVSRNTEVDLDVLPKILQAPARSIGVMGSQRRWNSTRAALTELGVSSVDLDRIRAPIGLELNAETPEEIAVSIMGEIVLSRRGGSGASMSDAVS